MSIVKLRLSRGNAISDIKTSSLKRAEGVVACTIFNLGISVDTTRNIMARIEHETKARTRHDIPPVVIVQIGVNDSGFDHGKVMVSIGEYKVNLETIVERVKRLGSKLIFVGLSACDEAKTNPCFWGDYSYTNQSIKAYEDTMREVATTNNIPFVPVFDQFTAALQKGASLLPDGLHPNNEGHEIIFKVVSPRLQKLLAD